LSVNGGGGCSFCFGGNAKKDNGKATEKTTAKKDGPITALYKWNLTNPSFGERVDAASRMFAPDIVDWGETGESGSFLDYARNTGAAVVNRPLNVLNAAIGVTPFVMAYQEATGNTVGVPTIQYSNKGKGAVAAIEFVSIAASAVAVAAPKGGGRTCEASAININRC